MICAVAAQKRKEMDKMSRQKFSDEQLIKLLQNPEYKNNNQIVKALGSKPYGALNNRLNQLRKNHGLPAADGRKKPGLEIALVIPDEPPETDPVKLDPFPFEPKEQVVFGGRLHTVRGVEINKLVMYENCSLRRVTVTLEAWNKNKNLVRGLNEKPPIKTAGEDVALKRRRQDEEPETPAKAAGTIFERVAARKADRKPAVINQDFEECFKPIDQTTEDEVPGLYEAEAIDTIESVPSDAGPLHIDLEMDDSADPVSLPAPFADVEYTDSDWGSAEKEISDTVLGRREYLDKIDQLLDLMAPMIKNKDIAYKTTGLAISILTTGISGEAGA
jgi:hypothetical protein